MSEPRWYVLDINPEQWRVGPLSVGRANGGQFARVGPDQQLQAYQNAVKEILEEDAQLTPGLVKLTLIFWRQMEEYKTQKSKANRRHQADLTNLQKALEDAIQGVLIDNDRDVREVHSFIAEQDHNTRPLVVIKVEPWNGFDPGNLPGHVWIEIDRTLSHANSVEEYGDDF
jgi:Holliday junction resolvase RusA-like endonuclease